MHRVHQADFGRRWCSHAWEQAFVDGVVFWAAHLMAPPLIATRSNGISVFQPWRQLGLGSYKTA